MTPIRLVRIVHTAALATATLLAAASLARALPNPLDTRFVAEPALSARHVAFVYAGDIWVADRNGQNVRRLTTDSGEGSSPVFSPDGKWVAFNAQYEGNTDVYFVPVTGGIPRRLTNLIRAWTALLLRTGFCF